MIEGRGSLPKSILFVSFLAVLSFMTNCAPEDAPERKLDGLINNDIPAGSTTSQVVEFLDSHGIEEFGFQEGEEPIFTPTVPRPKPEIKRYILARVRNVKRRLLRSWDLYVVFYFDDEGRLIDHQMKRIGSGL